MIASMTGYGRGTAEAEGASLSVEIRSVNGRQREVRCRMPQPLLALESSVRDRVQARIARGRVDVWIAWERGGAEQTAYALDPAAARSMLDAWRELREALGLGDEPRAEVLLRLPGVLVPVTGEALDVDAVRPLLDQAVERALDELDRGRRREGLSLLEDMSARLESVAGRLVTVRAQLADAPARQAEVLRERVTALLAETPIDDARMAQEIALLAQRADVTEELTRLEAHVARLRALLVPEAGTIGRETEFVVQEIRREINTLGVKSSSPDVDEEVLAIKSELEKIREQAANIE